MKIFVKYLPIRITFSFSASSSFLLSVNASFSCQFLDVEAEKQELLLHKFPSLPRERLAAPNGSFNCMWACKMAEAWISASARGCGHMKRTVGERTSRIFWFVGTRIVLGMITRAFYQKWQSLVSTKNIWLTDRVDSARRYWVSLSFSLNRATSARAIALISWLPSPWESFSLSISAFNSGERKNKLHHSEVLIPILRLIKATPRC